MRIWRQHPCGHPKVHRACASGRGGPAGVVYRLEATLHWAADRPQMVCSRIGCPHQHYAAVRETL